MKQLGCVLIFRPEVSRSQAAAALEQLKSLLDIPNTPLSHLQSFEMRDMLREFDPEWGFPVWYVP